jgi:hypothetical protein
MIAGILFFGKDLCSIGMDEAYIDEAIDKRVDLIDNGFGFLVAGYTVGTTTDADVNFCVWRSDLSSMTMNQWAMLSEAYRETFPTYDGHIVMIDMLHHTSDMQKASDAFHSMMENGTNLDDLIG